jgi:DNA (cytosine-5)-methyltransferase 1
MLRVVRVLRPAFVLIENVARLRSDGLTIVLRDLADSGYDAEWEVLSACAFGASHTRARVFIVAYPNGCGLEGMFGQLEEEDQEQNRKVGQLIFTGSDPPRRQRWKQLPSPCFCRSADGIPNRVGNTHALGNAVVPQVAEWIGRRILEVQHNARNAENT